jgi:hypothetical protein
LVLLLSLLPRIAGAREHIELYTMGPGDDVFSRFGHGALCVMNDEGGSNCYNYGTTDFSNPPHLIEDFLRQRAKFWVSTDDLDGMLAHYAQLDRTVYRQVLPLTAEQVQYVEDRLEHDELPEYREYYYHHFKDNCTTRVRDIIDGATGGALSRGNDVPYPQTYRDLVRGGFSASMPLLTLSEVLVGRSVDKKPTVYEAMFLPSVLRSEVEARLGVKPEIVNARKHAIPAPDLHAGALLWLALGVLLAGLVAAGEVAGATWTRRLSLIVWGAVSGLLGVLVWSMAIYSSRPEFRWNEMALVFLPTDLAVIGLPLAGRWLATYLRGRLVLVALVSLLAAIGVFVQPLWSPLSIVALPLAARELLRLPLRIPARAPAAETSA